MCGKRGSLPLRVGCANLGFFSTQKLAKVPGPEVRVASVNSGVCEVIRTFDSHQR